MYFKGEFYSRMSRGSIVSGLDKMATLFRSPVHWLIQFGKGVRFELDVPITSERTVHIIKSINQNATFQSNAAAVFHLFHDAYMNYKRGSLSLQQMYQQIVEASDLPKMRSNSITKYLEVQSRALIPPKDEKSLPLPEPTDAVLPTSDAPDGGH